jgi:GT2 family glycosyltransferase
MPRTVEVPERLLKPPEPPKVPAPPVVQGSAMAAAIKRLRLDVIALRRDMDHGTSPMVTRVVHRTAAHRLLRDPDVEISSITPLYNHGDLIGEALDSLALGAGPSTELIVVDDGSTDDSLQATLRWLRAHDQVPAVVIRHERNRGLAHARNTAAQFARGRFLFLLDADNTVFPGCLERLADALRADPDAAFAYPLIARHDIFGPLGLHAPFGWDPNRLRHGNYIDAMAMIRRSALVQLGGYSTDRRLYGWEDYDLWCRMAEQGLHGVLVPSVLARYRDSGSSMRSVVDVDHTEAYAALYEHAPRLFGGVLPSGPPARANAAHATNGAGADAP